MNTQPEALRLADLLEESYPLEPEAEQAAAELRRLHEVNQELLEALKDMRDFYYKANEYQEKARAAITKATGERDENQEITRHT